MLQSELFNASLRVNESNLGLNGIMNVSACERINLAEKNILFNSPDIFFQTT